MIRVLFGIFLVLHGLVHVLYAGQSLRFFELRPGMVWPDGSWIFSPLFGDWALRRLASAACALSALAFIAGGLGLLLAQDWWRPVVVGAASFSSLVYLLFWDGKLSKLDGQGAVGLMINLAILATVLILGWPA